MRVDYSYNPAKLGFEGTPFKEIFMGVEVEYPVKNRDFDEIGDKLCDAVGNNFIVAKRDGSLATYDYYSNGYEPHPNNEIGLELASKPASLRIHYNRWKPIFNFVPELKGVRTGGMHVHLSAKPLSTEVKRRMVCFIINPDNEKFLDHVAQRRPTDYSMRFTYFFKELKNKGNKEFPLAKWQDSLRNVTFNHHTAIHFSKKGTVEIRIFKSPILYEEFVKNLQFCDALVRWCMTKASDSADWKDFYKWIRKFKRYKELIEFIDRKF